MWCCGRARLISSVLASPSTWDILLTHFVLSQLSLHTLPAAHQPLVHFFCLTRAAHALSWQVLVAAVRQTLETSGLEVASFNGHSFRIGAATAAAEAGLLDSTIQQLGRWWPSAFTCYLRPPVQTIAQQSQSLLRNTLWVYHHPTMDTPLPCN